MSKPLYDDPVVAEIHAIRATMLEQCGGEHRTLMEQVRERERNSKRQVIPVPPAPVLSPSTEQTDEREPE